MKVLSDRSGRGARLPPALCAQQHDTECDPRALEHEQADVVDLIDWLVIEGDGDDDARRSDERQHPGAPEGLAESRRDQQVADEEQQEADCEEDEVLRDVAREDHRDHRLDGEEAEQRDPGDCDAPSTPSDPRTDEATKAPEGYGKSRDPEDEECDPEGFQRIPEGELPGLSCRDQCAGENRRDSRARVELDVMWVWSVRRGSGERTASARRVLAS